jgi:hypothetical protein
MKRTSLGYVLIIRRQGGAVTAVPFDSYAVDPPGAGSSAEAAFAADYTDAFEAFVRSMRGQGYRVDDRILEAAHVRAEQAAREKAMTRGDRSLPFRTLLADGLAAARKRHGY